MNFTWENPFIIRCLSPVNSLFACRSCGCWMYEKITFYKTHSWFTWIKKQGGRADWSKQTFGFGWFIGWLFINFVRLLGIYQRIACHRFFLTCWHCAEIVTTFGILQMIASHRPVICHCTTVFATFTILFISYKCYSCFFRHHFMLTTRKLVRYKTSHRHFGVLFFGGKEIA